MLAEDLGGDPGAVDDVAGIAERRDTRHVHILTNYSNQTTRQEGVPGLNYVLSLKPSQHPPKGLSWTSQGLEANGTPRCL